MITIMIMISFTNLITIIITVRVYPNTCGGERNHHEQLQFKCVLTATMFIRTTQYSSSKSHFLQVVDAMNE